MAEKSSKLHVLFLPFFTPSHMIPLVNAARLFAGEGVKVTILSTKHNTALVKRCVPQLGRKISFHNLRFPAAELGLPEGAETFPEAPSTEMTIKLYMALRRPLEEAILSISPHCIFSDMFYPWTVELARRMNIPRIIFYVNSFMSHCVPENLEKYETHKTVDSESETFLVPGLPDKVEMKRSNLEDYFKSESLFTGIMKKVKESERASFAVVFDNIYELEPEYADYFEKIIGTKIRTIGPLFHFANKLNASDTQETVQSLDWLESQELHSVLYISFGSLTQLFQAQIYEIATGLEKSNRPFIWVVRKSGPESEQESWFPEGFEERMAKSNKGLIFKGWAPQVAILKHDAIGGFMTHCGWNSILETITAGVPLITWPLFAEQFYNEIVTVRILKLGVSLGSEVWNRSPVIEGVLAGSSDIEKAILRLLCDSEESRKIRSRAKEIAEIVKGSVEVGGSSHRNLLELIRELHSCAFEARN